MKEAAYVTEALFLKHYPGRHKMAKPSLPAYEWKRIVLLTLGACSAITLTVFFTGLVFFQIMRSHDAARAAAEQRTEQLQYEIQRLQDLNVCSSTQAIQLAGKIQEVVDSAEGPQKKFLVLIIPEALRVQITHGIPASATTAMAIYESGYGKSALASHNNFFGLKAFASAWDGPKVFTATRDSGKSTMAYFREYPDIEAAVEGYAKFLKSSDRYARAFQYRDGAKFVETILKAGYCPDRDYHSHICDIIQRHQLKKLDLTELPASRAVSNSTPGREIAQSTLIPPWRKAQP